MKEVGGGGWGVYSQTYATGMYHPLKGRRGGKTLKEHGYVLPYLQTLQSWIGFRISKCDPREGYIFKPMVEKQAPQGFCSMLRHASA